MKLERRLTFVLESSETMDYSIRRRIRDLCGMIDSRLDEIDIVSARVVRAVRTDGAFTLPQWHRFKAVVENAIEQRDRWHRQFEDDRFSRAVLEQIAGIRKSWAEIVSDVDDLIRDARIVDVTGTHQPTRAELQRAGELEEGGA